MMAVKYEVDPDQYPDWYDYIDADIYHVAINGSLRRGRLTEYLYNKINKIIDVIISFPAQHEEVTTYRGVRSSIYNSLRVGDIFTDNAFISSTINKMNASNYAGRNGCILEILWGKGSNLAYNPNEQEFISLPVVEFEVVGTDQYIFQKNKYKVLIVEANIKLHQRKLENMIDEELTLLDEELPTIGRKYYERIIEELQLEDE